jgi:4-hydroxybenzoate polyprenyltransferase
MCAGVATSMPASFRVQFCVSLTALVKLMRPHQWLKGGFVFIGIVFNHAWSDPVKLSMALAAFTAFSLLSSAVYVGNDLLDREQDRLHPIKRLRPLAAGTVSGGAAIGLMAFCLITGGAIASVWAGSAPWVFLAYLVINVAYSFWLKHIVILDVFVIASGFMLRILAGTLAIGIEPSQWLLVCGLSVTLFLGFAKRRAEIGVGKADHRRVLEHYSASLLDQFTSICATATIISYALYTVSAETVALHGTRGLIVTVPFVIYGMFRYLWRLHNGNGAAGDPAADLLADRHLQATAIAWLALVLYILGGTNG